MQDVCWVSSSLMVVSVLVSVVPVLQTRGVADAKHGSTIPITLNDKIY